MKNVLFVLIILAAQSLSAQHISTDTIGSKSNFENINNTKLFSDSLASSFVILVKKEVKKHKHAFHSEHVVVLDGAALMTIAEKSFTIQKGDVIFIPQNTFHSVTTTSSVPLKVLSIQSPYFDGTDRVMK